MSFGEWPKSKPIQSKEEVLKQEPITIPEELWHDELYTPRKQEDINSDEYLPPIQVSSIINRTELFVQESLGKVLKGDLAREEAKKVIDRFGNSLEVTDVGLYTIITHLEHLSSLPEKFVKFMVEKGIKIKIGYKDMPGLSDDEVFRNQAPRGWPGTTNWSKVPGCFDSRHKTVYAGKGAHGSSSLILHEFGHGVGNLLKLDNSTELTETHKRLYKKLTSYLQQEGAGGFAGRQELLAEGFADYFRLKKKNFVRRYDEKFYLFIEEVISNNSSN